MIETFGGYIKESKRKTEEKAKVKPLSYPPKTFTLRNKNIKSLFKIFINQY